MKRTAATRFLALLLILGMVLSLPGVLLAAATAAAPGCSHCRSAGPGLTSGCCCCRPDMPGHCGAASQGRSSTCRCVSGSGPALTSAALAAAPAWQASTYVLAMVKLSPKIFPLNIFHPPESQV